MGAGTPVRGRARCWRSPAPTARPRRRLTVAMLRAGGLRTVAAGNTDVPLVDALDAGPRRVRRRVHELPAGVDARFRADAAAWLNLAPDHLNWHLDGVVRGGEGADLGPAAADDVGDRLRRRPGRDGATSPRRRRATCTFGRPAPTTTSPATAGCVGPGGRIADVASMRRCAAARRHERAWPRRHWCSRPASPTRGRVAAALATFAGAAAPHRAGRASATASSWFNDSKATTPHAASAAIRALRPRRADRRRANKGLDLSPMAAEPQRIRAVVAIGEAAADVAAVVRRPHRRRRMPARWPRPSTLAADAAPRRRRRAALARLRQLRLVPGLPRTAATTSAARRRVLARRAADREDAR